MQEAGPRVNFKVLVLIDIRFHEWYESWRISISYFLRIDGFNWNYDTMKWKIYDFTATIKLITYSAMDIFEILDAYSNLEKQIPHLHHSINHPTCHISIISSTLTPFKNSFQNRSSSRRHRDICKSLKFSAAIKREHSKTTTNTINTEKATKR